MIDFFGGITNVNNLTQNINLSDNYVYINISNEIDLNKSSNVTFYNMGSKGFTSPVLLRDEGISVPLLGILLVIIIRL